MSRRAETALHPPCPILLWASVAAAAFAVRALVAVAMGTLARPQLYEYHAIAQSLAAGQGFVYGHHGGTLYYSFTTPLYPWMCAALYRLGGGVAAVMVAQIALGAAHAGLLTAMGARLFSARVGLLAGALLALHPGLVVYSSMKAHPLTLDALLFTMVVWQCVRLAAERTWRRSVWAGLWAGLGWLSRSTCAALVMIGGVWLVATAPPRQRRLALAQAAGLLMIAGVVISPWLIRNLRLHHGAVLLQSTDWEVLWRGNNPHATGHSYIDGATLVLHQLPPEEQAALERLPTERDQARWFRERAVAFIREEPATFLRLWSRKLFSFWWAAPQTGVLYPRLWRWAYQGFYVLVLACAALGLWWIGRQGTVFQQRVLWLLAAAFAGLSLLQSLYYVEGRHRWGIEPLLLLSAAVGISAALDHRGLECRS